MTGPAARRTLAAFPKLAASLHPTRNGALGPSDISFGSTTRLWWRCPRKPYHVWQDTANHRTSGRGCPYCSGHRTHPRESLAAVRPDLARQWHARRNGSLSPRDVLPGSERRVWWRCPAGPDHEWESIVAIRGTMGGACPFCLGRRPSITNNLAARYPALARQWHPTRNGRLRSNDVTPGSDRTVWWRCARDRRHVWQTAVSNRVRGTGCPLCLGLAPSHQRTLAQWRPEIARLWHPTRNGALTPFDVTPASARRVWWKCPAGPDHEFQRSVLHQGAGKTKCPFCWNRRVSVTNCLATKFPKLAREWHPTRNRPLTPAEVVPGKPIKVWWRCDDGHEWPALLTNRTSNGSGCPVCARGARWRHRRRRRGRGLRAPILL